MSDRVPFPKFDRSDKPTVAETVAESRFESEAEARAAGIRKGLARPLIGLIALLGIGLGISQDSWTYIGILWGVVGVAWVVARLIVLWQVRTSRAERRRAKGAR